MSRHDDIIGYFLELDIPNVIFLYDQRTHFRMPMLQKSTLKEISYSHDGSLHIVELEECISPLYQTDTPKSISISNISPSGCQLSLNFDFDPNWLAKTYLLDLTSTSTMPILVTGTLKYCCKNPQNPREFIAGIEFLPFDEEVKAQLQDYLIGLEGLALEELKSSAPSEHKKESIMSPIMRSALTSSRTLTLILFPLHKRPVSCHSEISSSLRMIKFSLKRILWVFFDHYYGRLCRRQQR